MIQLPRLVGSRQAAGNLLSAQDHVFRDAVVVVDCSELRTGTASFADALVAGILVEGEAKELQLRDAPPAFATLVRGAAERRNVGSQVSLVDADGVSTV